MNQDWLAESNQGDPDAVRVTAGVQATARLVTAGGQRVLASGYAAEPGPCDRFPWSAARSADGVFLLASGVGAMQRWDGLAPTLETAGVAAPATGCTITMTEAVFRPPSLSATVPSSFTGGLPAVTTTTVRSEEVWEQQNRRGIAPRPDTLPASSYLVQYFFDNQDAYLAWLDTRLIGRYGAYVRYIDKYGNVSDLSPFAGPVTSGRTRNKTSDIDLDLIARLNRLGSPYRNFTGSGGGAGAAAMRPFFPAAPLSDVEAAAAGPYPLASTLIEAAAGSITYTNVPVPTDPKVARRQILRNTAGQFDTFYVDVDTTDLASTTFTSTNSDGFLQTQEAVPLFDQYGLDLANRYGVPPDHKPFLASQGDRMYAAGSRVYDLGSCQVTNGSATVTGVGTHWRSAFAGRFFHAKGWGTAHEILSCDGGAQTLTLVVPFAGPTNQFQEYAIRVPPAERRLLYFSGVGLPESWSYADAVSLEEDGDEITGLTVINSFLYVLERHHVYRFTTRADPINDGAAFLAADRGCVNHRCCVVTGSEAYLLDRRGVWRLAPNEQAQEVAAAVADLFRGDGDGLTICWRNAGAFHASHDPAQRVIRWFVTLSGDCRPRHALCHAYEQKRWWVEEYQIPITASCTVFTDEPLVLVGSWGGQVYALTDQPLDQVAPDASTLQGTVTAATAFSLDDTSAAFPAALVGVPVTIATGRGAGQVRVITAVTSTRLTVDHPWRIKPSAAGDDQSTYQVGGTPWVWRTGWLRFPDEEQSARRAVRLWWKPLAGTQAALLRFYRDQAAVPVALGWSLNAAHATLVKGVRESVVDLATPGGYAQVRRDGGRERDVPLPDVVMVELGGAGGSARLALRGVDIEGSLGGQDGG